MRVGGTVETPRVSVRAYSAPVPSHFRWHDEWLAILASQQLVRGRIADELLTFGIERQFWPDPQDRFLRLDTDGFGVFQQRHDAVADDLVVAEIRWLLKLARPAH